MIIVLKFPLTLITAPHINVLVNAKLLREKKNTTVNNASEQLQK